MIYNIIIAPLELVFDWIFLSVHHSFPRFGVVGAIFGLSLAVNIFAFPIYNIADRIQKCERDAVRDMEKWVRHIRRTFKGNERFMMLSEYYRQNNYHPIYALRSTFSILVQIPFFIAAYHYLRNCDALSGASFWIIKDLSAPDALLSLNLQGGGMYKYPSDCYVSNKLRERHNVFKRYVCSREGSDLRTCGCIPCLAI